MRAAGSTRARTGRGTEPHVNASPRVKPIPLLAGLVVFALPLVIGGELASYREFGARPAVAAGLALWMATWWITEAVPIHWTACLPVLVLPFTSVYGEGWGANLVGALTPFVD